MSLKKAPLSLFLATFVRLGLVLSFALSFSMAQAVEGSTETVIEVSKDAPKESMFQAGKATSS